MLVLLALLSSALSAFHEPPSDAVDHVNPLIGNGGDTPNGSGGMIPSTAPPFAMTRWVAQTRENYVSVTPYNETDGVIRGFQGTHQPAIWMGESAAVWVVPGTGAVKDLFEERGLSFDKKDEVTSASYYKVLLDRGAILAEQSATSRVGHLRFTFNSSSSPYILVQATRPSVLGSSDPKNVTYPHGTITIFPSTREICGTNPERQDSIIGPVSTPAAGFKGYFCARFDRTFASFGIAKNGTVTEDETSGEGKVLSAFARFEAGVVNVRIGVSFISIDQARKNLDTEIPDGTSLEETARRTRSAWVEKLDRIRIEGGTEEEKTTFYTAVFHTLQSEDGRYYSGYDDAVHEGDSYTGYSIWDTYRAEWAWLILFAPERVPGMVRSMLQDYQQGGWLPMWKNIIETNIMVGTHADSLIAEAVIKGVSGFDLGLAYEAVLKDATVPPVNDQNTSYYDREEGVDYEVRAGLSTAYATEGWVAADIHSESGSRTLDYAYDDYALSVLASTLASLSSPPPNLPPLSVLTSAARFYLARSLRAPYTLFDARTGFMRARNADGSWAGLEDGWTEGDRWVYSFDIVHDVGGLVKRRGGREAFVRSLDEHFEGGHNDHTNEPSHHVPYLYALAGAAGKTQERVREIAKREYNATARGLNGNEDCGQMSAWYVFGALGFYPLDPVSGTYVVGSPFFDRIEILLPGIEKRLMITSPGAPDDPYVKSLRVNGIPTADPIIAHGDIVRGGEIAFEMSARGEEWGSGYVVRPRGESESWDTLGHDEL